MHFSKHMKLTFAAAIAFALFSGVVMATDASASGETSTQLDIDCAALSANG